MTVASWGEMMASFIPIIHPHHLSLGFTVLLQAYFDAMGFEAMGTNAGLQ
jgi:hypothetical protein